MRIVVVFFKIFMVCFLVSLLCTAYAQNSPYNWIWGTGQYGQLGTGAFTNHATPIHVNTATPFIGIGGGGNHNFGLRADGTLLAWGENTQGELGNGSFTSNPPGGISNPALVNNVNSVVMVSGGSGHGAALKIDGTIATWGRNIEGELGTGAFTPSYPYGIANATQASGILSAVAVSSEWSHTLALIADGRVWSWGFNNNGQLGNGSYSTVSPYAVALPAVVTGITGVTAIASGGYHSIALKSDGTVWIWGDNSYGQLGNGTFTRSATPAKMTNISDVVSISGGLYHSAAVKKDGTVWAWGYNEYGQVGNGTFTLGPTYSITTPVQVSGIANVQSVYCSAYSTFALKRDGTVWSWGYNGEGNLGVGFFSSNPPYGISVPTQVIGLSNIFAVGGAGFSSMALSTSVPITINVNVSLQGWAGSSLPLVFANIDGGAMQGYTMTPISSNNGIFTLRAAASGSHLVKVKVSGYLAKKATVIISGVTANLNIAALTAGDANNDNIIEDSDILVVINKFLSSGPEGDINGDGIVDDTDLLYTINNFLDIGD